jgi:AFG3 family protein
MVDHIEVTNKSVAKVYVYNSAPQEGTGGTVDELQTDGRQSTNGNRGVRYKYYFNIGSIESFERKLEDAQDTLGVDPHDYIPVTYVSEMSWQQELLRLAPTLLIIAGYIFFTRRMQGGFGVGGGGGGMGGRGIFNVGKAQVTKLNQKAKDKVDTQTCTHRWCFSARGPRSIVKSVDEIKKWSCTTNASFVRV